MLRIAVLGATGRMGRALTGLIAEDDSPTSDRMDLLSVVLHEFGHVLGLGDLDPLTDSDHPMTETLAPGIRRLPEPEEVDVVFTADPDFDG